jgi:hypothetical protein
MNYLNYLDLSQVWVREDLATVDDLRVISAEIIRQLSPVKTVNRPELEQYKQQIIEMFQMISDESSPSDDINLNFSAAMRHLYSFAESSVIGIPNGCILYVETQNPVSEEQYIKSEELRNHALHFTAFAGME